MKKWLLIFLGLCLVSLAGVHFFAPALIENNFNRHLNHPTFAVSENAQKLHNTLFVADLHSDSMLWKRNFLEESQRGHMDLPRLIKGNVALQIFAATTKVPSNMTYKGNSSDEDSLTMLTVGQLQPPATWFSLYQRAEWQLLKLTLFTDKSNGGLVLIRNSADLNQLVLGRQRGDRIVGGIFGIEGAHALEGDIENLERLYEKGLRVTRQVVHCMVYLEMVCLISERKLLKQPIIWESLLMLLMPLHKWYQISCRSHLNR